MTKSALKSLFYAVFLLFALPSAALSGFGRWKRAYGTFATAYALAPGVIGDYLRIAFYRLTLAECSLDSRISFGSFFAHPEARLGKRVYIGSYCIFGTVDIGARTHIADGVQVLSGKHQHTRDSSGQISGSEHGVFTRVSVGTECWIGAAAVVMADIGEGSTIGAGSVVTKPVPPGSVAVGNPARVINSATSLG